jgi:hypothetical protein
MSTIVLQPRADCARGCGLYRRTQGPPGSPGSGTAKVGVFTHYDRYALDTLDVRLDGIGALNTPQQTVNGVGGPEDPEAALERFLAP